MKESKTYQLTLPPHIIERIEHTARRVYVKPEEFLLFALLCGLNDLQSGKRQVPFYRKILEKLERELNL